MTLSFYAIAQKKKEQPYTLFIPLFRFNKNNILLRLLRYCNMIYVLLSIYQHYNNLLYCTELSPPLGFFFFFLLLYRYDAASDRNGQQTKNGEIHTVTLQRTLLCIHSANPIAPPGRPQKINSLVKRLHLYTGTECKSVRKPLVVRNEMSNGAMYGLIEVV